ncbi:MAG: GIY-YIG nuclease family protein [Syntrophaceae bacterium]|nr:GIY-YIG nuclease family protein [Syntrophaceae bacterium]
MYVYFIQTGDAIKVGIASDLTKRMVSVQVGNPHKIEVLHSISTSEEEARKIESQIHELFKRTHLHGEWFHANQFMIDFIRHIKENGWESHSDWIDSQYHKVYGDSLTSLKTKIEKDIIIGNMVSLEKLKQDLGKLVNTIYAIPSLPSNMAEAIRKWIENRKDPFVIRDVYSEFGITTRNGKKNISVILKRLVADGMLEQSGKPYRCIYKRKC